MKNPRYIVCLEMDAEKYAELKMSLVALSIDYMSEAQTDNGKWGLHVLLSEFYNPIWVKEFNESVGK